MLTETVIIFKIEIDFKNKFHKTIGEIVFHYMHIRMTTTTIDSSIVL